MRKWLRNIYFLSINYLSDSKMLEPSNNMTPQRKDNEIVIQLCIMNQ